MVFVEPNVKTVKATFAMFCFASPEAKFGCTPGVVRTKVGFTGGTTKNPTYENIGDHTETVEVEYDPEVANYQNLLDVFWNNHDPTICLKKQYTSTIFYHDEEQKQLAEETLQTIQKKTSRPIATKILPREIFYDAENYLQKFMLRQKPELLKCLNLSDEQMVSSFAACRLNGYSAGDGTLSAFNDEVDNIGLSDDQANTFRRAITAAEATTWV